MNTQKLLEALRGCVADLQDCLDDNNGHSEALDKSLVLLEEADQHRDHFHMVFAEVLYTTPRPNRQQEIKGTRVSVFTKAKDLQFPLGRLTHILNSCAMQARNDLDNPQNFQLVDVKILNMYHLGQFTDEEFYAGIQKKVEIAEPESLIQN